MDTWIKLNSSASGKDKLFRVLQFALRLINVYLKQKPRVANGLATRLHHLEALISQFRKTLRLGGCVDALRSASRSLHYREPCLRVTLTLSRIARFMLLACDHVVWLSHAGLITADSVKWSTIYYRCWLYGAVIRLCRDMYEFGAVRRDCLSLSALSASGNIYPVKNVSITSAPSWRSLRLLVSLHRELLLDTVANSCEVAVALHALNNISSRQRGAASSSWISAGVAAAGLISSCLQLWTVCDPSMAMKPA